jgi:hypothetical protein
VSAKEVVPSPDFVVSSSFSPFGCCLSASVARGEGDDDDVVENPFETTPHGLDDGSDDFGVQERAEEEEKYREGCRREWKMSISLRTACGGDDDDDSVKMVGVAG